MPTPLDIAKRQITLSTDRIHALPVVVLMPHSRCNCRCVMCDIWKANRNGHELSREDLAPHLDAFRRLRVRRVVLSGGEALLHSNLWTLCEMLRDLGVAITLLSTGLLLDRHADDVVRWCDEVIVSLDGSREVHDRIRNVPRAFDRLAEGVVALKRRQPAFRVTARCVVQRLNYADVPAVIDVAHDLGLDQISFLAADVSTEAFNRAEPWDDERAGTVALSPAETAAFSGIIEEVISANAGDFASRFIAESPDQLRRLPRYFAALHGLAGFPETHCNAPWVSTVVEADGTVRPCFFHRPLGNIHERPIDTILNSDDAVAFRRNLNVKTDPICSKCVCTLNLKPWREA